jgi:hypothetical protein
MEDRIDMLVEQWSLEEIFEMCDITPQQVISILFEGGHIDLPEFIKDRELYDGQDAEA